VREAGARIHVHAPSVRKERPHAIGHSAQRVVGGHRRAKRGASALSARRPRQPTLHVEEIQIEQPRLELPAPDPNDGVAHFEVQPDRRQHRRQGLAQRELFQLASERSHRVGVDRDAVGRTGREQPEDLVDGTRLEEGERQPARRIERRIARVDLRGRQRRQSAGRTRLTGGRCLTCPLARYADDWKVLPPPGEQQDRRRERDAVHKSLEINYLRQPNGPECPEARAAAQFC
jgi:hypothetical protein